MHTPRIAHFVSGGGSGATRVALDLAAGQAKAGNFQPLLILRVKRGRDPQPWIDEAGRHGVACRLVPSGFKLRTIGQLARIFREERVDIAVAHGFSEHLWGRLAALRARVPVVAMVEHNLEKYGPLRLLLSRWLARRTHRVWCVSAAVRDHYTGRGHAPGNTRVIHNSVKDAAFRAAALPWEARAPDPVMVARWARQKDQATLIRAFAHLRAAGRDQLELHLVGGGRQRHERRARRLAAALGVAGSVRFHGPRRDVPAILGRHRIFVLSTRYEGFALALLEAMAAGCAVVATRAPGVAELIRDGENGVSVPPGDAPALAAAISNLLNDDQLCRQLAQRGQNEVAERYSPDRMVAAYDQDLLELWANRS